MANARLAVTLLYMKNTEQTLLKEIRDLKRKLEAKDKENTSLVRELARIKHGIKRVDIALIVEGNDMTDWGWASGEEANKRAAKLKKLYNLDEGFWKNWHGTRVL